MKEELSGMVAGGEEEEWVAMVKRDPALIPSRIAEND
jgi:hypothetical protein